MEMEMARRGRGRDGNREDIISDVDENQSVENELHNVARPSRRLWMANSD